MPTREQRAPRARPDPFPRPFPSTLPLDSSPRPFPSTLSLDPCPRPLPSLADACPRALHPAPCTLHSWTWGTTPIEYATFLSLLYDTITNSGEEGDGELKLFDAITFADLPAKACSRQNMREHAESSFPSPRRTTVYTATTSARSAHAEGLKALKAEQSGAPLASPRRAEEKSRARMRGIVCALHAFHACICMRMSMFHVACSMWHVACMRVWHVAIPTASLLPHALCFRP